MVSREETAKIEYTLPDPAEAYKQAGAAFKGAPWIGQQQYAQSEEVMAAAQQLSEVVDHANLKAAKAEALDDLDKQINGTADGEIRQQLLKIRDRVMAAHSKDAVSEAIAMARTGAIAADAKYAGKDDMQQDRLNQEIAQNWLQIKELNTKTTKTFDELSDFTTDEEKKKHKELEELIANEKDDAKRLEYQKQLNALNRSVAERVEEGTQPGSADYEKAKEFKKDIKKTEIMVTEIHDKDNQVKEIQEKADTQKASPHSSAASQAIEDNRGAEKTLGLFVLKSNELQNIKKMSEPEIQPVGTKPANSFEVASISANETGGFSSPNSPAPPKSGAKENAVF